VESARAAGADVEVIVVDDASTDETAAVCQRLEGITYIRAEGHQGVAEARNIGILASSAAYIAFLDDDDLRLPGSIDRQLEFLESYPQAGFVCGAMILADQDYLPTGELSVPQHPGGDIFWELLELEFPVMPLCVLIRKECLLRTGLLKKQLAGIDDWDIFVRLAELYPVVVSQEPVGIYRQPTTSSGQGSSLRAAQLSRAARHQLQLLQLPRALQSSASRRRQARRRAVNRIADTLLWRAVSCLQAGEYRDACASIGVAVRLNPLRAMRPQAVYKLALRFIGRHASSRM
jgi:glycosyltransferase involved in cell wall biosynthesis